MRPIIKQRARKIKVRKPKFVVNEPGMYDVTVERAELKQTRKGDPMMVLRLLVRGGSAFNEFLVCDGKADTKAAKSLAECLDAFGFTPEDTDDFDLDALLNCSAKVEVDIRVTAEGAEFNYVKNWLLPNDADVEAKPQESTGETATEEHRGGVPTQ